MGKVTTGPGGGGGSVRGGPSPYVKSGGFVRGNPTTVPGGGSNKNKGGGNASIPGLKAGKKSQKGRM